MIWVLGRPRFVLAFIFGHEVWQGLRCKEEEEPSNERKVQMVGEEGEEGVKIPVGHCEKKSFWIVWLGRG